MIRQLCAHPRPMDRLFRGVMKDVQKHGTAKKFPHAGTLSVLDIDCRYQS